MPQTPQRTRRPLASRLTLPVVSAGLAWFVLVPIAGAEPTLRPLTTDPATDVRPTWAPDGQRIAFSSSRSGNSDLWVVSSSGGEPAQLTAHPAFDDHPDWSPDGSSIAFESRRDGNSSSIWVLHLSDGALRRITDDTADERQPAWTADGGDILFMSNRAGNEDIWRIGTGQLPFLQQITTNPLRDYEPACSPDGRSIAFASRIADPAPRTGIWTVNAGGGLPVPAYLPSATAFEPAWSPDGRWIAFSSNVGGAYDICLLPVSGGQLLRLTNDAARDYQPAWSPDGREIAFVSDRVGSFDVWIASNLFDGGWSSVPGGLAHTMPSTWGFVKRVFER